MDNPPKIPSGYADRTLRIIMVVAFFPALAFLSACVFSYLFVPTIGLIPMAASLTINIIALKSPKSPIRTKPIADAIVALSLLAVMVYLWMELLSGYINVVEAMLSAYGISPMIVNFCVHAYIALRTILPSPFGPTQCPNCDHSVLPRWQQERHAHVTLPADAEEVVQVRA